MVFYDKSSFRPSTKSAATRPTALSDVMRIMGKGAGCSATWGAKIDANFAKKLQNPNAVATNNVGKRSAMHT